MAETTHELPKVFVFAGPTAVGKSSLALEICRTMNGELISADSVQVYKGLNIGSNKASDKERAEVPHHLLDVICPSDEKFTAGRFVREARNCIDDVLSRGKVPVICGGTPMYLQWLVHGPPDAPPSDPTLALQIAKQLQPFEATKDWASGIKLLSDLDPTRANALQTNDWYRLGRALEIATTLHSNGGEEKIINNEENNISQFNKNDDRIDDKYDFRCFFLSPNDRWGLFEKIDKRCEEMLIGLENIEQTYETSRPLVLNDNDINNNNNNGHNGHNIDDRAAEDKSEKNMRSDKQHHHKRIKKNENNQDPFSLSCHEGRGRTRVGLLEETAHLLSTGYLTQWSMPGRAIGYRQAIEYLLRPPTSPKTSSTSSTSTSTPSKIISNVDIESYNDFISSFCTATRNYASQQMKWFRKDPKFMFIQIDFPIQNPPIVKKNQNQNNKQYKNNQNNQNQNKIIKKDVNDQEEKNIVSKRTNDDDNDDDDDNNTSNSNSECNNSLKGIKTLTKQEQLSIIKDHIVKQYKITRKEFDEELNSNEQKEIRYNLANQNKQMRKYQYKKYWLLKNDEEEQLSSRQKKRLLSKAKQQNAQLIGKGKGKRKNNLVLPLESSSSSLLSSTSNERISISEMILKANLCTDLVRKADVKLEKDPNILFRHILPEMIEK